MNKLIWISLILVLSLNGALAESKISTFDSNSYSQIVQQHGKTGFLLSIWSIDCPSCLKDMAILKELHQKHPKLRIVLLSTDEPSAAEDVKNMLQRQQLSDLENWQFGAQDAEKLRYQIDPSWYGELPRSYAFSPQQQRLGKSGAMSLIEFEQWLKQAGLI